MGLLIVVLVSLKNTGDDSCKHVKFPFVKCSKKQA